ncbi:hypothetical protein WDW89_03435 [Deltaproteobacteria bacterium TL4]
MYKIRQMILMILLFVMLSVCALKPAKAAGLELVFQDTLWGGALGGVVGLAVWGLQERSDDEKPETFSLRGVSIGILGGMLFGFYEVKQTSTGFSQNRLQPAPEDSLLFYDQRSNLLRISWLQGMPKPHYSGENLSYQAFLLGIKF